MGSPVPTFYLYGEPHRAVDAGFLHVEALDDRSRPSEWTIRSHSHAELSHLFLIQTGGGTMTADGRTLHLVAPALLVVPARVVHGFVWSSESSGWVATLAQSEVDIVLRGDPELSPLFDHARIVPLDTADADTASEQFGTLQRELGWILPGRRASMRCALETLLVLAVRRSLVACAAATPVGRQAALIARFRQRVEDRFRRREPMSSHAAALGVSESALRAACAAIAGMAPAAMLDQRALQEARRALLYSNLSVAEIGWALGFADAAYFSRFFARHTGQAASAYRNAAGRGEPQSAVYR